MVVNRGIMYQRVASETSTYCQLCSLLLCFTCITLPSLSAQMSLVYDSAAVHHQSVNHCTKLMYLSANLWSLAWYESEDAHYTCELCCYRHCMVQIRRITCMHVLYARFYNIRYCMTNWREWVYEVGCSFVRFSLLVNCSFLWLLSSFSVLELDCIFVCFYTISHWLQKPSPKCVQWNDLNNSNVSEKKEANSFSTITLAFLDRFS